MADSVHILFEELNDLLGVFSDFEGESSESDSDDEKRERRKQRKIRMQPFYAHRRDIFSILDDAQVMCTFRFDESSLSYIVGLIEELLPTRSSRAKRCLTPLDQLLVALQFFATGTFQSVVGNVLKLSQRSVGRSIHAVTDALCRIAPHHININPNLLEEETQFSEIAGMPGVIGCIDGTHVKISRPHEFEGAFVHRKGYHSINVQGVCNANYKFVSVSANQPGSVHDSTVFKGSAFGKLCASGQFGSGYLLGDSGYACTTYLLTPFAVPSTPEEERYNMAHKTTRCTIERAFGILKRRFHCLHGELRVQPGRACRIILACCVLHNIALARGQPTEFEDEGVDAGKLFEIPMPPIQPLNQPLNERVLRQQGFERRQRLAYSHFKN